jgi:hypothetical protein
MNALIALQGTVIDLEARVARLEAGGTSSGGTPAVGPIEIRYKDSPDGLQLVPGNPTPFRHRFTVSNLSDQGLTIGLTATLNAPHGNWTGKVQIDSPSAFVPSQGTKELSVLVTVPTDAQLGDAVQLTVAAQVGPPHNKFSSDKTPALSVASSSGPPVVRTISFAGDPLLPASNPDDVAPGQILAYGFNVQYSASESPFSAAFVFKITANATPAATLGEWFLDFAGAQRDNPSPEIFTTPVVLESAPGASKRITVRIKAPATRGTGDKKLTFTASLESPNLAGVATPPPVSLAIRLRQ